MTWNPDNKLAAWGYDKLRRDLMTPFQKNGFAEITWKLRAYKHAVIGDDIVILKQGKRPTGIFAVGKIIGEAQLIHSSRQLTPAYRARLKITKIVDPAEDFLLTEGECRDILGDALVNCRASGQLIPADKAKKLSQRLNTRAIASGRP